ncbi:MAG: alpha/beta hydrolase [Pseudomonadales bacterium]|nr:alpha/beta hydrolase [Pseudomonadales bacterium]
MKQPIKQASEMVEKQLSRAMLQTVPVAALEKAFGITEPLTVDGRTMDPLLRVVCEANKAKPSVESFGVEKGREVYEKIVETLDSPFAKNVIKRDRTITLDSDLEGPRDIKIRIYEKDQAHAKQKPVMVFFHGGGWVVGSVDSTDRLCALFADALDHIVVSVNYRLTPNHPFPAAQYDAVDAFTWIQANAAHFGGDSDRVYTCGDSAGGQLSTVTAQQTTLLGRPAPCLQVMIYPGVDCHHRGESHQTLGEGYLLTRSMLDWFRDTFLPDISQRDNPLASPIYADEALLAKLPPAILTTAGFDLLRDDGAAYAERLKQAGCDTTYIEFDALAHGYVTMTGVVPSAKQAILDTAEQIKLKLASL